MDQNKFVETTGASVEEAISKGLAELGARPFEVIVEVLEEPSQGILGIGAHPAKVRLQLLSVPKPPPPPMPAPTTEPAADEIIQFPTAREGFVASEVHPSREDRPQREDRPRRDSRPAREDRPRREDRPPRASKPADDYGVSDDDMGMVVTGDEIPETEQDDEAQIGKVVLNELLTKMDISARIIVRRAHPGEPGESTPWVLDVTGSNLNRLIGRRGETLAALQYITRLITSRELQRRSEVVVDIGGYKAKRAQTLHNLAVRMADEAVQRSHTVTLEPMPPHERRIIHLALRERTDVVTRSVGEGAARKVTIVPSSQA